MEHIFLPHLPLKKKNTTLSKSIYVDFPVYVDERWPELLSYWPKSQHSTICFWVPTLFLPEGSFYV